MTRKRLLPCVAVIALSCPWASAQVCGDCDGSASVTILDALLAAQHGAGQITLIGQDFVNCDVDLSATVSILDALRLAQAAGGLVVTLSCQPPVVFTITEISFDWSLAVPDGYGLRVNAATDVVVPEWLPTAGRNSPALFVGGQRPTIRFRATSNPPVSQATFRITTGGSAIGDFDDVVVNFVAGTSGQTNIQLTNAVPALLDKHTISFDWRARDIGGTGSPEALVATTGPHTVYTVISAPTAPWTASGVTEPWTRMLDYVTQWAGGTTTTTGALDAMVPPFRDNYGMMYDTIQGAPGYSVGLTWTLNLSLMIVRMDTASMGIMCCYDPARALAVFGNLVGGDFRFWFLDGPNGFWINCVDLNGRGWSNSPFYSVDSSPMIRPPDMGVPRWRFGNHAFTGTSSAAPPTAVWDGTFAGDGDGNADEPPHVRTDMVSMTYPIYSGITVDTVPFATTYAPYIINFTFQ